MMIRKITAITFLWLASVLLLAFSVLPHHHHQEYICFATSHCADASQDEGHSHDGNSQDGHHTCLHSLLQTEISRIENLEHSCENGHCHHFTLMPFMVSEILSLLSHEADANSYSGIFYREQLHAVCYSSDLGGRAPPYKG